MAGITKEDVCGWFKEINEDCSFDELMARPVTMPEGGPYAFNAKTVGDVLDYLTEDRSYGDRWHRSPLSWAVKAHNVDVNGDGQHERTPELDEAWAKYLDSRAGQWVHERAFEEAQEQYRADWCSYPGDDQGDWRMEFWGRSGGHLTVTEWRGHKIEGMDSEDYARFLASLLDDFACGKNDLLLLYIGVKTADRDFTYANASKEVSYHYGFYREQWEEERERYVKQLSLELLAACGKVEKEYGVSVTVGDLRRAVEEAIEGKEETEDV